MQRFSKYLLITLFTLAVAVAFFSNLEIVKAGMLKKVVAVSRFENNTSWRGQWALDQGMTDQLTDALIQSGKFVVMERETLSDVIEEQDLAASGRTAISKSAQTGKLVSAQILIKGAITEFAQKSGGGGQQIGIKGFKIGQKKEEAHVAVIIRLIDTTTGQVLNSKRVEGKAKSGGISWGASTGGVTFGSQGFKKTPLGKATQIAIDNAVAYIASEMENVPFKGRVIKSSGGVIYINAGGRNNVSVGDTFGVYSAGEPLIDPDTGETLGFDESRIGTIKVTSVQEKFSKATKVSGGTIAKGSTIKVE
jgi:curli biogenesis system outer membrane secretion channel CsgG